MPHRSQYPDPDRLAGCLLGGAIGDALGAPVESLSLADIRRRHGRRGLTGYLPDRFGPGAITAGTQLTMVTTQALVQASVRARAKGIGGAAPGMLQYAYLRLLHGQGERLKSIADEAGQSVTWPNLPPLQPALTARRGMSRTCLMALRIAAKSPRPGVPVGTPEEPINDSKGSAAIVRAAPCGFGFHDPEGAFRLGCQAAALTHGHPGGYLPAGVLASIVCELVRGAAVDQAVERARAVLERHPAHDETSAALDAAVALARPGPLTPERLERLGSGWTGAEALAIAVCVALHVAADVKDGALEPTLAGDGPQGIGRRGLLAAVNHSGDSDTTGSICGNVLGARFGTRAFPGAWQSGLEVRRAIVQLAADCALEFGPGPPTDEDGVPPIDWPREGLET